MPAIQRETPYAAEKGQPPQLPRCSRPHGLRDSPPAPQRRHKEWQARMQTSFERLAQSVDAHGRHDQRELDPSERVSTSAAAIPTALQVPAEATHTSRRTRWSRLCRACMPSPAEKTAACPMPAQAAPPQRGAAQVATVFTFTAAASCGCARQPQRRSALRREATARDSDSEADPVKHGTPNPPALRSSPVPSPPHALMTGLPL